MSSELEGFVMALNLLRVDQRSLGSGAMVEVGVVRRGAVQTQRRDGAMHQVLCTGREVMYTLHTKLGLRLTCRSKCFSSHSTISGCSTLTYVHVHCEHKHMHHMSEEKWCGTRVELLTESHDRSGLNKIRS